MSSGLVDIMEKCFKLVAVRSVSIDIKSMFILLKSPFKQLDTEHKRCKYFENSRSLIKPVEYKLERYEMRSQKDH